MTISNDLDSNLSLLSRISSDGRNQSNQLNVLLTTTSQTCFVREDFSVPLREFMETFLSYHPATQFPPVEHHTPKHDSLYLEDVGVAADWFKINIDHYPENIDEKFKSDQFIITTTFMVTTMLPIELAELRLIVLNSPIFENFSRPMQTLLKMQLISSHISIGESLTAKTFLNRVSKSDKFSSIPEFKALQDSLSEVKSESPDPELSPESNDTHLTSIPAIIDGFQGQEDIIDIKPNLDQLQNYTQSSKNQYDFSDDEKPSLDTRSNTFANQDPISMIDEGVCDTKPNLENIQHPRRSSRKRRSTSEDEKPLITATFDSIINQNEGKRVKRTSTERTSKKRQDSSDEDELSDSTSNINNDRPKLDDILSRVSEILEELKNSKGVSKNQCQKTLKTLDDKCHKIRTITASEKNRQVSDVDSYMDTYRCYRNWCAKQHFSELPITFDKAFVWAELGLRSNSAHSRKIKRRIRELDWFRGETISMGSDEISFWPDSFWKEYLDDARFPHVFLTRGGSPRRDAYPKINKHGDQMNKVPAPMPPQRKRPKAPSPIPSTSLSPKKRPKFESKSVCCEAIPEVMLLDDEPSPDPKDSKITLDTDLESRQDMEEGKYVISTNHTSPEPINKIDFNSIRKPKHIHEHRLAIIDQLRWESEGIIVRPKLFTDAFWKYKTDGITPLERLGSGVREESKRTLEKYLEYCERYSIMALPFTKMKLYLFFIEVFHHLSLSTTRNYSRYLFYAVKIMRIMIPNLAGESITIEELKASQLWKRWLDERDEYDRLRRSGKPSH